MINDAIKLLRTLFLVSVGIIVLWLYVFPQTVETFRLYDSARDLYAWILIKERFKAFEMDIFEVARDQNVRELQFEGIISARGDDGIEKYPLEVTATWPKTGVYSITLIAHQKFSDNIPDLVRIYAVNAADLSKLPFSSYLIVFSSVPELSGTFVVPDDARNFLDPDHVALRQIAWAARAQNQPRSWDTVAPYLLKHGFNGDPKELTSHNTAVRAFATEVDPASTIRAVKVFGLQLSISAFFFAVGVLLSTVAFAMIGPLRGIRGAGGRAYRQAWIMATPRGHGWIGTLLEGLVAAVTYLWAISPFYILLLQWKTALEAEGIQRTALFASSIGLVLSSTVFIAVALQLRHYRKATAFRENNGEEKHITASS